MKNAFRLFCILNFAFCIGGCSIPNLEPQSCIDSRTAVRELYSFHFGNGLAFGDDDLDRRKDFLTPEFYKWLRFPPRDVPPGMDPFTLTYNDPPKAFRVGECKEIDQQRTEFQVVIFWKDDVRSEERKILVEATKRNERWLINRVSGAAIK